MHLIPYQACFGRHHAASYDWLLILLLMFAAFACPAGAVALEKPAGRVILTITGDISNTNDGKAATFDRAMLEAFPQTTIRTVTPWTDGETDFTGPYVRDVMAAVGAGGTKAMATAINDYQVTIPVSDFDMYGVIMALTRDGKPLTVRDRGPIWIVYPWGDQPELANEIYHSRSIWQLKAIEVK